MNILLTHLNMLTDEIDDFCFGQFGIRHRTSTAAPRRLCAEGVYLLRHPGLFTGGGVVVIHAFSSGRIDQRDKLLMRRLGLTAILGINRRKNAFNARPNPAANNPIMNAPLLTLSVTLCGRTLGNQTKYPPIQS